MASRRQVVASSSTVENPLDLSGLADVLGASLGRGIARGINMGLMGSVGPAPSRVAASSTPRKARLKTLAAGQVPADRRCTVEGCTSVVRSKGLCSRHYQAERRRVAKLG